jgi:hypothetical protein
MAYIGQNLDRFSIVEKLDVITPATATGAGPYNLTKGSVAFVPSSADTMVVSIDGVIQYGNFTVSGSTITFSAALADVNTCDFIYQMGTGFITTPADGTVNTAQLASGAVSPIKFSTAGIAAGNVIKVNDAGNAWELGNASSAEVYGFSKNSDGQLIITTTNQGTDSISSATFATFDDTLFSASGFTFSISNGNLIATI